MRRKCDFSVLPMPELRLYHSRKKCEKFLARHQIPFNPIDGDDAQTWTFRDGGMPYAVVLYDGDIQYDYWEDMGMLAHEATHIALFAFGDIGESEPAEEEMCYTVQAISKWLCKAHFKWKEKRIAVSSGEK